jgi:two-component SAPR family response regulator
MKYFLIDDDDIISIIHPQIIKKADSDAEIKVFKNSEEAFDLLKKIQISNLRIPDFIFLDINMPFLTGFEFLDQFSEDQKIYFSLTKFIILSSSIDSKDLEKSKKYPMVYDFIHKPLTKEYIKSLIEA